MLAPAIAQQMELLIMAWLCVGAMLFFRILTFDEAMKSINWGVLIVIAASIGIGNTLDVTGAARLVADKVLGSTSSKFGVYSAIFFLTVLITQIVTNNAAASIMFPIVYNIFKSSNLQLEPIMYVLMMAASMSFMTPIGYQTNLLVQSPGG